MPYCNLRSCFHFIFLMQVNNNFLSVGNADKEVTVMTANLCMLHLQIRKCLGLCSFTAEFFAFIFHFLSWKKTCIKTWCKLFFLSNIRFHWSLNLCSMLLLTKYIFNSYVTRVRCSFFFEPFEWTRMCVKLACLFVYVEAWN